MCTNSGRVYILRFSVTYTGITLGFITRLLISVPSGEVLQVLEGLMKPEVQHYIRDLVHFVKQNKPQVCIESDIRENALDVRLILMLTKSF